MPTPALVVGLTGGIGSGKSSAAAIFQEFGVPVIDTDAIARSLTDHKTPAPNNAGSPQSALQAIAQQFGADMLTADGALDRARMRARVFADTAARKRLEAILHPRIRAEVLRELAQVTAPYVILMVPLLIEGGGYRDVIQRILVVDCDETLQIARATRRDGLTEADVRAIMAAQASRETRRAQADDLITNNDDLPTLRTAVTHLHERYLRLAHV